MGWSRSAPCPLARVRVRARARPGRMGPPSHHCGCVHLGWERGEGSRVEIAPDQSLDVLLGDLLPKKGEIFPQIRTHRGAKMLYQLGVRV